MRLVATSIGSAICGALCFGIWPEMWKTYGIMGGWMTAAIVISICWYMNHWLGIVWNEKGRIWVDQGWAVSAAGIAWAMVRFNSQFRHAVPGILCCLAGGALAGVAAAKVKRHHPGFGQARQAAAPKENAGA